jgi:hypothetical protein
MLALNKSFSCKASSSEVPGMMPPFRTSAALRARVVSETCLLPMAERTCTPGPSGHPDVSA